MKIYRKIFSMFPVHFPSLAIYHSQPHLSLKSKPDFDFHPLYTKLFLSERKEFVLNLGVDRASISFWENLPRLDSKFGIELLTNKVSSSKTSFRFFYDTLLIGIDQTDVLFSLSAYDWICQDLRKGICWWFRNYPHVSLTIYLETSFIPILYWINHN